MGWTYILKSFFGPREFLEHFQEKLGGNIVSSESRSHRTRSSKRNRNSSETTLQHSNGFLKVVSKGGKYYISKDNAVIVSGLSLKELLPIVENNLKE